MNQRLASEEWNTAIARLIRAGSGQETADALIDAIGEVVDHDGTCLLAFHHDAPPEILHHTLDAAGASHYLDRYLAGPYLLDPLYQLALRDNKPGICRYRDEAPDRFTSSEYYRQYCERTHLTDEMDFLLDVGSGSAVALVVGRRESRFKKSELDRLGQIETIVHSAMLNIWDRWQSRENRDERNKNLHRRLTECFENFGDPLLTQPSAAAQPGSLRATARPRPLNRPRGRDGESGGPGVPSGAVGKRFRRSRRGIGGHPTACCIPCSARARLSASDRCSFFLPCFMPERALPRRSRSPYKF